MPVLIPIPNQSSFLPIGKIVEPLIKISNLVGEAPDNEVVLDFSRTAFLNIAFITGLHCLMMQWRSEGYDVNCEYGNSAIKSYLQTVCFDKGHHLSEQDDTLNHFLATAKTSGKRFLPVTCFPCLGLSDSGESVFDLVWDQLIEAVKKLLQHPPTAYWQIFPYILEELGINVKEHSRAPAGTFALQYYPTNKMIQVVIADNGRGIFRSYDESPHFHPQTELEAFQLAMQGKSSKDRPKAESRGFGIETSRKILVAGAEGSYFIWSGQTTYVRRPQNDGIVTLNDTFPAARFGGTFTVLQIPLRNDLLIDFKQATEGR